MDLPMSSNYTVQVDNLSKVYPIYGKPYDLLLWLVCRQLGRTRFVPKSVNAFLTKLADRHVREFRALENIAFSLREGECLGIIGRNGSGKSTLLQLIAGTLNPTDGAIDVKGRVAALLELGSGFNPEFTGRENVFINGAISGLGRTEIKDRFEEIAAFADIGDFIDQPVKTYSSGMFVRLAFAVQAFIDPDILVVDEALSVGDIFFQQKCHARIEEMLGRKITVIMVSHDMRVIEKYSHRALLLDKGRCVFLGPPDEAVQNYYHLPTVATSSNENQAPHVQVSLDENLHEFKSDHPIDDWPVESSFFDFSPAHMIGDPEAARCTRIAVCDEQGRPCFTFEIGDWARFYYEFHLLRDIWVPVGGVTLTNSLNLDIHGKTSLQHQVATPPRIPRGCRVRFRQSIQLSVAHGEYTFTVSLASIRPEVYARVLHMDYALLAPETNTVIRIQRAGRLLVVERTRGLSFPFHGFADLQGDCQISVENSSSQA